MRDATENLRDKLGICQWFHFQDYAAVERAVEAMHELGVRHLRTGISWADFHRAGGRDWYDWQMKQLADFVVLLSLWHTPPSISEGGVCNSPPQRLRDFADFVDRVIEYYGDSFDALELWNEPNNRYKWDFVRFDPQWRKFGEMICDAAHWARQRGATTVLGGMIPVDPQWLARIETYGAIDCIDAIGIHAFPGMWWPNHDNWDWMDRWHGWDEKVQTIRAAAGDRPIWVTETGLATFDLASGCAGKHSLQVEKLRDAAQAPAERIYWYSLIDLDPQREAIEGFHADENEYHMGLITHDGARKPAFDAMRELLSDSAISQPEPLAARSAGRVFPA